MKHLTAHARGLVSIVSFTFILSLAVSCKKQPTTPPSGSTAKGYLTSDTTSCYPTHTHGIWYSGIGAGTDSNYIDVTLNITSPGSFAIHTDTVNGVSFSGSGSVSTIGVYTIPLKATGIFSHWGPTSFKVQFDSSACNFIAYVQDSAALSMTDNTWELTAWGVYYHGPIVQGGLNLPPGQATELRVFGDGSFENRYDTIMTIDLNPNGPVLDTVPYYTNQEFYSSFLFKARDTLKANPYLINAFANNGSGSANMKIQIKSMVPYVTDNVYQTIVYGEFEGTAEDTWNQNHLAPITKGRFKLVN